MWRWKRCNISTKNVKRKRTLQLCEQTQPGFIWQVRFFRFFGSPLSIVLDYAVMAVSTRWILARITRLPVPTIDDAKAKVSGSGTISKRTHPDYKGLQNIETGLAKTKKNRRDYNIDFVVPALKVGDAEYKFYLQNIGR
jgi:hypothetical protein